MKISKTSEASSLIFWTINLIFSKGQNFVDLKSTFPTPKQVKSVSICPLQTHSHTPISNCIPRQPLRGETSKSQIDCRTVIWTRTEILNDEGCNSSRCTSSVRDLALCPIDLGWFQYRIQDMMRQYVRNRTFPWSVYITFHPLHQWRCGADHHVPALNCDPFRVCGHISLNDDILAHPALTVY